MGFKNIFVPLYVETTHVLVVHVFEHAQLSVGPLGVDCGLEGPGDLLDGDPHRLPVRPAGLGVLGRTHLQQ